MGRSLLSVSIVTGPSTPELLGRLAKTEAKVRLGLLASPRQGEGPASNSETTSLFVEELARPRAGDGYVPEQIAKQIRAIADRKSVDHLLIECDAATPPMAFASLFVPQAETAHSLPEVARLAATILAITPTLLLDALIHRRDAADTFSPCFIAEQMEFASIVFLQGDPNDPAFGLAGEIILALNPAAQVFELSQDNLERVLEGAGAFDFAAALEGAGWRKLIESDYADQLQGKVRALAYHARKPFHPARFWNLLHEGFSGVFRAKGFFWLASRMDFAGGLNLAGAEFHCASAGNWWAARDDHAREFHMPVRTRKEWQEPFGDRRQAIAFFGIELDPDSLRRQLDSCLLTDSEVAAGEAGWQELIDPFPSWSSHHHHHDHGCDHDHGSGEHDCCHH
jgi:G3E family GTPase